MNNGLHDHLPLRPLHIRSHPCLPREEMSMGKSALIICLKEYRMEVKSLDMHADQVIQLKSYPS